MKVCHACGHSHQFMASASNAAETRYFCHEDGHSCYNDNRGNYFGELDALGIDPKTPEGLIKWIHHLMGVTVLPRP